MKAELQAQPAPRLTLSALRVVKAAAEGEQDSPKIQALTSRFWARRAEELLHDLQEKLTLGVERKAAVSELLRETAAGIAILIEDGRGFTVSTAWASPGLYWTTDATGCIHLGDEESSLAITTGRLKLDARSVVRYLHDDANISPLGSLYQGIRRIPGGCHASFGSTGGPPVLEPMPIDAAPHGALPAPLHSSITATAAEIIREAGDAEIVAHISGGIDGLVILASLVSQGARVRAIYGDDGVYQHQINQDVIDALKQRFPHADLSYQWIEKGSIPATTLETLQENRCRHLIKGNYLKRDYKLALADAGSLAEQLRPVCIVNGYGIDELYAGAKGDASLSTIYPRSADLTVARLLSNWRTSRPGLGLIRWRAWILRQLGGSTLERLEALAQQLRSAGKAGGNLGTCCRADVLPRFEAALEADSEELARHLWPMLRDASSEREWAACCKRFIYGLVEQTHLVRFAGHECAADVPVLLPFEAGRVRRALEAELPALQESWNPKGHLRSYLKMLGVDYDAIIAERARNLARNRKHQRLALEKSRAALKALAAPLRRWKPVRKTTTDRGMLRALEDARKHHPGARELSGLLQELTAITGGAYIESLELAIRRGSAEAGSFKTKQVYNYAHLVRYVLSTRNATRCL